MHTRFIPIWKSAPALRYLPPVMFGIVTEWYFPMPLLLIACFFAAFFLGFILLTRRRRLAGSIYVGVSFYLLLFWVGCSVALLGNQQNQASFIGKGYSPGNTILATLEEPLSVKAKSYKAEASVFVVDSLGRQKALTGRIILYFEKGQQPPKMGYGSRILFSRPLQPIQNGGNPGGFDYARYSLFHGVFYQVFLKDRDYMPDRTRRYSRFRALLFATRQQVLQTFRAFIPGKAESGLAEALLVGYRDDLDRQLVEQYSNTGVVHIIAISGMHLGLIYGLLLGVLKPVTRGKSGLMVRALLIVAALWFFSFLTGAAPSITRSAIMFTTIALGESANRRSSIYNSLCLSALALLLVGPFNLWDVGFQLSYAAVLSIAVFGKPVQALITPSLAVFRLLWQLISVTLAAQIFTLPLVLYHFHQFPSYFLLSNIIAVPLSSIILYALLVLLCLIPLPLLAGFLGTAIHHAIGGMNAYISWVNGLPYSTIGNIYFSIFQTLCISLVLVLVTWWLFYRNFRALQLAGMALILLLTARNIQFFENRQRRLLLVYNVPGKCAIDLFNAGQYRFMGDSSLAAAGFLQNFHLRPTRILYQAMPALPAAGHSAFSTVKLGVKKVLILNESVDLGRSQPQPCELVILGGGVRNDPAGLMFFLGCKTIVLDSSVPQYRLKQWRIAADSLNLRLHSVSQQGAYACFF